MKVIEINEGTKIPYEVSGTNVCLDDDLTINLAKRQQDWPVYMDICRDTDGNLVIGTGVGKYYVAQFDIPAIEYETEIIEADKEGEESTSVQNALPLDMEKVVLTLWSTELNASPIGGGE